MKTKTKQVAADNLCKIENYLQFYLDLSDVIEEMLPPDEVTKIKKNFDLQLVLNSVFENTITMVN